MIRVCQGLFLSFGSPLGWLVIRLLGGSTLDIELTQYGIYLYTGIGTAIVFTGFGYYVGRNEKRLTHLSLRDPLTNLFNARYFHARLHEAFAEQQRKNQPLSVVQIDLDHFKKINDNYGHLAGDAVLRVVAESLQNSSRRGETVARVGGEEFCVILMGAGLEVATQAAERFLAGIRSLSIEVSPAVSVQITASLGVASSTRVEGNEWALYQAADAAMYKAKEAGRNRVAVV